MAQMLVVIQTQKRWFLTHILHIVNEKKTHRDRMTMGC